MKRNTQIKQEARESLTEGRERILWVGMSSLSIQYTFIRAEN